MFRSKNTFTTRQGATIGIHSYAQDAVIFFGYTAKKSFYIRVMWIGHAQRWFRNHALDPFCGNHSFLHCINCVSGKVQWWGFNFHVVLTYQFTLFGGPIWR